VQLPDFLTRDADGFIRVTGHRIGLSNLVHYYNDGLSAEMLACEYPTLPLSLVHKVIAFYLENRTTTDAYIAGCEEEIERQRSSVPNGPSAAELRRRLDTMHGVERA
jgi:uncharacterized protein (DUF433 family)